MLPMLRLLISEILPESVERLSLRGGLESGTDILKMVDPRVLEVV